jgi:hypothetical protein
MANTILTPTAVTKEALRILHNNVVIAKKVNRQYDSQFAKSGAKIGTSLYIRIPNQFTVRTGAALNAQDITESSVTMTVATQIGVDVNFTTAELTMSLDDFGVRILKPAMSRLASEVDVYCANLYKDVYQLVGTWGTTPASSTTILAAHKMLKQALAPTDGEWALCCTANTEASIVDTFKGYFQNQKAIADQYDNGSMGKAFGFNWYSTENIQSLTAGSMDNTTPVVNGASQTGSTLAITGADASATVKQGQVFTAAGCYRVNPETKVTTGDLQQFVVTADATCAGGAVTLSISPSIVTSGATQNVSASPTNGGAISWVEGAAASTTKAQNLAFHREAFALVTADLEMPNGMDFASRQVMDGISMRILRGYDINSDKIPCRIDILLGVKAVRPEWAVRITE